MDRRLYRAADAGHLILTVNDRLARHLGRQYDAAQQQAGRSCWLRPEIFSLSGWLYRSHEQWPDPPHLLNPAQRQYLWEQIIEEDVRATGNDLLQIPQTANRAHQAHQLLITYAADFDRSLAAEDHRAFLRWRDAWRQRAAMNRWHDPAELTDLIASAIEGGLLSPPEQIILAGFDEIPPNLERLCRVMTGRGSSIVSWQPVPLEPVSRTCVDADDPEQEVSLCAGWARGLLLDNPDTRVGIVAPQLDAYQALLEQVLPAELAPQAFWAGEDAQDIYNISLGQRLDCEGVIDAAMRLLRFQARLDCDDAAWIMTTPYTLDASRERFARAQLDRELRRRYRRHDWTWSDLSHAVKHLSSKLVLQAVSYIKILEVLSQETRRKRTQRPGAWAEHFSNLLGRLGWPGDRGLDSREYQAVAHFRQALGELASLDGMARPMGRAEAVKTLGRLVAAVEFQPEGKDAPVQVLGLLESGGLQFDHLWVLGLHDMALPSLPKPNPFIPLTVQRNHRMKRCDAEREMAFADQVSQRLLSAADEIIVSWPQTDQGVELRPSPYLMAIPPGLPKVAESASPVNLLHAAKAELESLVDARAPGLSSRKPFAGGTTIIKDQALCPFRAFAHHRLHAEALDAPEPGFDNLSRGTLAHTVLELFWKDVGDQASLCAMDDEERSEKIGRAVEAALDRLARERRSDLPERQRRLERERLSGVVEQWLQIERQRGAFRVKTSEEALRLDLGGLTIRARIDRVDELADGTLAVIDYKTGRPDPAQWLEERITEPQLPIYSLGPFRDRIGAVMFAAVRTRKEESGFRGLAKDREAWPNAGSRKLTQCCEELGLENLHEVLAFWERVLTGLGAAFVRGDAAVDPIDPERACRYCDLTNLCRILEQTTSALGDGDG